MQYALENWPPSHEQYLKKGEAGAYFYKDTVYKQLGY